MPERSRVGPDPPVDCDMAERASAPPAAASRSGSRWRSPEHVTRIDSLPKLPDSGSSPQFLRIGERRGFSAVEVSGG